MKILFVSDNFPPEVNAPASRTYEHAKRWAAAGIDVTVITCAPNFPLGRVHRGYRNAWRTAEDVDGIRVVRVKTYITQNEGFFRRVLDYVSFMLSAVFFSCFEKRPDVVIGTSPQFFTAVGAWLISVLRWRPFVFELRDLWPASIVTVEAMNKGTAIRLLESLELFLYRRAAAVISVTESFKKDLIERGIDGAKIHVVRNGVDLSRYQPRPPSGELAEQLGVSNRFVVGYLGTFGMAHALDNVARAAQLLADEPNLVFLLVGHGAQEKELRALVTELDLDNVVIHGFVPKEQMPELWSICDVALVHLKDDPVFSTVIPSKIFEALGMGKPVLIAQPDGEAVDLVRKASAGVWVTPGQPEALAEAVRDLYRRPESLAQFARNAGEAAGEHSRDRLAGDMAKILHRVCDS